MGSSESATKRVTIEREEDNLMVRICLGFQVWQFVLTLTPRPVFFSYTANSAQGCAEPRKVARSIKYFGTLYAR